MAEIADPDLPVDYEDVQRCVVVLKGARPPELRSVLQGKGDEFCILVPGTSQEGAIAAAEGFVDAVVKAAETSPLPEGTELVGASAGVACYPGDGDDGTALISRADEALYHAKETGRGRVVRLPPS